MNRDSSIPIDPQGVGQLLSELARVRAEFQLRAILTAMEIPASIKARLLAGEPQ